MADMGTPPATSRGAKRARDYDEEAEQILRAEYNRGYADGVKHHDGFFLEGYRAGLQEVYSTAFSTGVLQDPACGRPSRPRPCIFPRKIQERGRWQKWYHAAPPFPDLKKCDQAMDSQA